MTVPGFKDFLETPEALKTHLYFGNAPLEVKPKLNQRLKQPKLILPPVFSYMDFLLIQTLSETGHGEFRVQIERKNNEFVVFVKSHLSQRYFLSHKESEIMHEAYQQIITNWKNWWQSELR